MLICMIFKFLSKTVLFLGKSVKQFSLDFLCFVDQREVLLLFSHNIKMKAVWSVFITGIFDRKTYLIWSYLSA